MATELIGCHCKSNCQFSEYGSLFRGSYPPNRSGFVPCIKPGVEIPAACGEVQVPVAFSPWQGTSAATCERFAGGGGGGVVPNGCAKQLVCVAGSYALVHELVVGMTKGASSVTPNGPLKPLPALGESSE